MTPITIAISAIGIVRRVAVKSPSSSHGPPGTPVGVLTTHRRRVLSGFEERGRGLRELVAVRDARAIEHRAAARRDRDEHDALVLGIRRRGDEADGLEPIDAARRRV